MGENSDRNHIDEVLLRYLAEKIMEDLRSGNQLAEDFCNALTGYPEIDSLRKAVGSEDTDVIIGLCQSQNRAKRSLGFALLQPIVGNEKIQGFLKQLWDDANDNDYEAKRLLVWRILDISDLPSDFHEDIYRFVKKHWHAFIADNENWVQGDVLDYCKERLSNMYIPESKSWIYLLLASTSDRKEEVRKLLDQYGESKASIVSTVINDLISKTILLHHTSV